MTKLFAVSDIHGNLDSFISAAIQAGLLDIAWNWIGGNSTLVICGDYIDRGPDSKGVIDNVIRIKSQAEAAGGKVHTIMGNHEKMLLDGMTDEGWFMCFIRNGGVQTLLSYKDIIDLYVGYESEQLVTIYNHHKQFFDELVPYVNIEGNFFVHAGVHPEGTIKNIVNVKEGFEKEVAHLWIRNEFFDHKDSLFLEKYGAKRIIFGHTPTAYMTRRYQEAMKPVEKMGGKLLAIDTGSYYDIGCVTIVEILETGYRVAGKGKQ